MSLSQTFRSLPRAWIYLVAEDKTNYTKVGISSNPPKSRARELGTGNPRQLILFYSRELPSGQAALTLERAVLDWQRGLGHWTRNEWFRHKGLREEIAAWIDAQADDLRKAA